MSKFPQALVSDRAAEALFATLSLLGPLPLLFSLVPADGIAPSLNAAICALVVVAYVAGPVALFVSIASTKAATFAITQLIVVAHMVIALACFEGFSELARLSVIMAFFTSTGVMGMLLDRKVLARYLLGDSPLHRRKSHRTTGEVQLWLAFDKVDIPVSVRDISDGGFGAVAFHEDLAPLLADFRRGKQVRLVVKQGRSPTIIPCRVAWQTSDGQSVRFGLEVASQEQMTDIRGLIPIASAKSRVQPVYQSS